MTNPFKRLFGFGEGPEEKRIPPEGDLPRVNDMEAKRPASPDPDLHHPAAASTDTDAEAGGGLEKSDQGGITPLRPRQATTGSEP